MATVEDNFVIADAELEAFKKDYYNGTGGKYNLEIQAPHLAKLADGYLNRYNETGDWTDALKAHTLCNSVAVRNTEDSRHWTAKAIKLQNKVLQNDTSKSDSSMHEENLMTDRLVRHLQETRMQCREELVDISLLSDEMSAPNTPENKEITRKFYDRVSQLSLYCTDRMIALAEMVFQLSVEILTNVPCEFCVVALGSLAKGEGTPYSDFEYMFLTEKKDDQTLPYFEKLAMASYFLIGNLRETKLDSMAISELTGWFQDKQRSGFKIDGLKKNAGNIPTGNGLEGSKNWLILTPDDLLERYREVFLDSDMEKAKIGDFTAMLHYTRLVYSHERVPGRLLAKFGEQKIAQANQSRTDANLAMLKADCEKFDFKPTEKCTNQRFFIDTKNELYRYPSILLNDISILLGVSESSSWGTLQALKTGGLISYSIHEYLSFILACSCYFRLSTYLFYGSQNDRLSVLPLSVFQVVHGRSFPKIPKLAGDRWYLSQDVFNMYCRYSVPLKNLISKRVENQEVQNILTLDIPPPSWLVEFQMYHYCNRWSESQHYFQEHIEGNIMQNPEEAIKMIQKEFPNDLHKLWNCVKALTYSLSEHRHDKVALIYNETILRMVEETRMKRNAELHHTFLADIYAQIGTSYYGLNQYHEAKEMFEQALVVWTCLKEGKNVEFSEKMHLKLGECHLMMYQCGKSIDHLVQSLQICYDNDLESTPLSTVSVDLFLESPERRLTFFINPTVVLAHVIWTLGIAYQYTKYYKRALIYCQKALEMFLELYGENGCHRDIANTLFHLAVIDEYLHTEVPASKYNLESFVTTVQLYGTEQQLMETVARIDDWTSKSFYEFVIALFPQLQRFRVAHSQTASVFCVVGNHLTYNKRYKLAEMAFQLTLDVLDNLICPDEYSYPYKAQTLAGRANNNWRNGDGLSAEQLYGKALDTLSGRSEPCSMLDAAEILASKGDMYVSLAESEQDHVVASRYYHKAKECYELSKHQNQSGCSDPEHPQLAEIEERLCQVEHKLGNKA